MSRLSPGSSLKHWRAFTLIELLLVVSIIVVIGGMLVPAVGPLFRGNQMTVAADQVAGMLNTARQSALARDATVEIRFYYYNPLNSGSSSHFCGMQSFDFNQVTNQYTPLDKALTLPNSLIIDQGAALSSMLSNISTSGTTSTFPIPAVGTGYKYLRFDFFKDGSTNLMTLLPTLGPKYFFTIHFLTDGDNLQNAPRDFATLQIDPYNGSIKTYRP